jgi:phosphoesterase RecJ-like protein
MDEHVTELQRLISDARIILITSHIGPDGDSVCSSVLLSKILKTSFPDKTVVVSMEEKALGLDFIEGVKEIVCQPLAESLLSHQPDLFIILDANTVDRLTRDPDKARKALASIDAKIAIIDHHEPQSPDSPAAHINNASPAVTLDIYEIFIEKLKYEKPAGYAQTTATGIYTDTGGFVNRNSNYRKTFETMPKLIADGADLEAINSQLSRISPEGFQVLKELINHTSLQTDHTFSYISDQTTAGQEALEAVRQATDIFRSEFLRNITGRPWGYIVYRDVLAPRQTYAVSFRALGEAKDVSILARQLGGGGHKPAAGAKIEAGSVDEAINKVQQVINGSET